MGYIALATFYTASSRELKRLGKLTDAMVQHMHIAIKCFHLDGILRSFLYAHFSESLSGLATIRAYNATDRFITENGKHIDRENAALYVFTGASLRELFYSPGN